MPANHLSTEAQSRRQTARLAACRAALAAWQAIEPLYEGDCTVEQKADGPCTEADRLADRLIVERLVPDFPAESHAYLTEESEADPRRREFDRVWIIDPIDGTKDFIQHNGNFAIHIGLAEREGDGHWRPTVGVVFRPIAGFLYSSVAGEGAWRQKVERRDGETPLLGIPERIRVTERAEYARMRSVVSNSHRTSRLTRLIDGLGLEDYWHVGSLGIKLCSIAEGAAELYVNLGLGKSKDWDTCAPHAILNEAGGRLTDLDGEEITYNRPDVKHQRGLIATNALPHARVVGDVAAFLEHNPA